MVNHDFEKEVLEARQEIFSESYPMSLGELTNLFKDGELVISPAFQRLFRWDDEQKSRLIESILLGIPLPSIFVSQTQDGKWELIDGLQRVSTILQLQGLLPEKDPLVLQGTKYLPGLDGRAWESRGGEPELPNSLRLDFKRSKLDLKILKRDSSPKTKYDLFQRLNSYGSPLTAQEMRNAALVGVSAPFAKWIEELANIDDFVDTTVLSDRQRTEKYGEELVLRFLFLHDVRETSAVSLRGFSQRLDDAAVGLADNFPARKDTLEHVFRTTFQVIARSADDDAFRKWDAARGKFSGGFSNTAFEIIAVGLGYNIASSLPYREDVLEATKEIWTAAEMRGRYSTGVSTESRLSRTLPFGRKLMGA
ncbi:DUF262 domain-containing protein [Microbacterium maritypicum]|uniref:DUF262 domain-containing protein n=1 Tax=Microbacterium maritypicum TaxID=33918 RepID=UPI003CF03D8C